MCLLTFSGCLRLRAPVTPMTALDISPAGAPSAPCLIVFLPGRRDSPSAYRRHHFAEMAAAAGVSARFLEADAHLGYYQARTASTRLEQDIVAPARAAGAKKIWIVGISMGGLGGLLMAREHPDLQGVVALAPFLGDTEPGLVAKAGGLAAWTPGPPRPVADYEREPESVEATEELYGRWLFPTHGTPTAYTEVAEVEGRVVAIALWYPTFSTWTGSPGIWLEDLFVEPAHRGAGIGRALLGRLAQVCVERGYRRLEWWVLGWNTPSIAFYDSLGARPMGDWVHYRMDGDELAALAARAPSA